MALFPCLIGEGRGEGHSATPRRGPLRVDAQQAKVDALKQLQAQTQARFASTRCCYPACWIGRSKVIWCRGRSVYRFRAEHTGSPQRLTDWGQTLNEERIKAGSGMPQKSTPFEDAYPNITQWVESYGWLEIGQDDSSPSFIKVLDEGGLVWESSKKYVSLDAAWRDLEARLGKIIDEIGQASSARR